MKKTLKMVRFTKPIKIKITMKYLYTKKIKAGEIVHIGDIPVEVLNDVEVGSNTRFEIIDSQDDLPTVLPEENNH